ncbi:methyltransferase domain-containing protein [Xylariomycetidae sp. FL0641]|nr:methyltransferase domain-containing protein [Xylariomycetidae sp. FL0641]
MSAISPPTSCTSRCRRATSCAESPYAAAPPSPDTARTLSTRSPRSSASVASDASRSARADASSGEVPASLLRLRMRSSKAIMIPSKPLPYQDCWDNADDYVDHLLEFATTSHQFQILCGGVHVLDFFTNEPGLFSAVVPEDWQVFLRQCEPMRLLDLLMRDDLEALAEPQPPQSFVKYIKDIRRLALARDFGVDEKKLPKLTRQVSVGMKPKKIHEVRNFASYVDNLADDIATECNEHITHFVDFGSGQNYLGRALACAPYNKQIVAVEGREHNITGAKELDLLAGLSKQPKLMRNKKLFMQQLDNELAKDELDEKALRRAAKELKISDDYIPDLRPRAITEAIYKPEEGKGFIRYVTGRLESGDLADVVSQLDDIPAGEKNGRDELSLMAISIHSCGNLSHHGIRSLVLNPQVRAIAIVGCCYNLLTEKLGPPTYKHPYMRPSLQAMNGRVVRESERRDPQGFPMSERLCTYKGDGVRLNITARMMACQAPQNWTEAESENFFTRHFFRAVLQKIFLDRGVIRKVYHDGSTGEERADGSPESPFNMSTNPVIIGSLRKSCYGSFNSYVRGAIAKLTTVSEYHEYRDVIREKMSGITDEEIAQYEATYGPRKSELSAIWSLMAFSATVVEALIVTDRWLFLRQHSDLVQHCWAETVFDFGQSPRNLVVVGVKRPS